MGIFTSSQPFQLFSLASCLPQVFEPFSRLDILLPSVIFCSHHYFGFFHTQTRRTKGEREIPQEQGKGLGVLQEGNGTLKKICRSQKSDFGRRFVFI